MADPRLWKLGPTGSERYTELGHRLKAEAIEHPGEWVSREIDKVVRVHIDTEHAANQMRSMLAERRQAQIWSQWDDVCLAVWESWTGGDRPARADSGPNTGLRIACRYLTEAAVYEFLIGRPEADIPDEDFVKARGEAAKWMGLDPDRWSEKGTQAVE